MPPDSRNLFVRRPGMIKAEQKAVDVPIATSMGSSVWQSADACINVMLGRPCCTFLAAGTSRRYHPTRTQPLVLQALWQVLGLMARHGCLLQQQGQGSGAATPPSSVRGPAAARGPAADAPGAAVELADVLTVGALLLTGGLASRGRPGALFSTLRNRCCWQRLQCSGWSVLICQPACC